jgi:hypothetical protein
MKRILSAVLACVVAVATIAMAEEAAPAATSIKGKVAVVKEGDAVKAITLTAKEGEAEVVYEVAVDENGTKLAAKDGQDAEVKGTVAEKDGKKTLTVTEIVETPAADAAAPAADAAAAPAAEPTK